MNLAARISTSLRSFARACLAAVAVAGALSLMAGSAQAAFGLQEFENTFTDAEGNPALDAGSHPYAATTFFRAVNDPGFPGNPDGRVKDAFFEQIAGFAGDTTAYPQCSTVDFVTSDPSNAQPICPTDTVVGANQTNIINNFFWFQSPLFNLVPPPGVAARFGFKAINVLVVIDARINPDTYNVVASSTGISEVEPVYGNHTQLWGNPSDSSHDDKRCGGGTIVTAFPPTKPEFKPGFCSEAVPARGPFLTMPTRCTGPNVTTYAADEWLAPARLLPTGMPDLSDSRWDTGSFTTPNLRGCDLLRLPASTSARPTSRAAQSPSGLDFAIDVEDPQLKSNAPDARASSHIKRAVVTLPKGLTINASQAEGLEVCSEADLANETLDSAPGEGCPQASKVGTIEVDSPLVDQTIPGSLYVAEPYANLADDSLIAVYVVLRNRDLGVIVKQPIKVEPDPETGQLVSTAANLPQLPFSSFRLHFREGGRAPLITPPGCGTFQTKGVLHPWSGNAPTETSSSFELISGPNGSDCPSGSAPFNPGFSAGTLNNSAGDYSPFVMRLTRGDGEQDLTRFSAVFPPGVAGRIAGIPKCSEADIAQAKGRSGERGGTEELEDPSCPSDSLIGTTSAAAGVGSQLTYVAGKLYLAGAYKGAPLSVVSITPAVAGPFDAGTVVVRVGLRLNPVTGVVEVDGSASDAIPHILQGIPLNVRDLRVNANRPEFTLNATSCEESQATATIFGGGTLLDPKPDTPVQSSARYQAAGCAALDFTPRLAIRLYGGVRRGAFPALRAVVTPPPGQANFSRAAVTLPSSAFIEQGHFGSICTRVQFAAGAGNGSECPPASRYGFARAWSPLLDGPARGPVYLRSSDNELPDLVVALKGPASAPVDVELDARIDSVRSGLRATFASIPDLPVSRFVLGMQGGKKGLIVNSRHLCFKPKRNTATANLRGQNGKLHRIKPRVVSMTCAKRRRAQRAQARRATPPRAARAGVSGARLAR